MNSHDKGGIDRRTLLAASAIGGAASSVGAAGQVLAQAAPAAPTASPSAAAPPPSAAVAAKAVESTRDVILRISREVWTNAEGLFAEEKSAAIHVRELKAAGFKCLSDEMLNRMNHL